jgi:DNA-binding transcriptional regulator YiaG
MGHETHLSTAEEVRECRKALGLTLNDFAGKLGVTLRAVQYWEAGTRRPGNAALTLIRRFRPRKGQ